MLAPDNVSVPAPLLVKPPVPLITLEIVVLLAPEIVKRKPPLVSVPLLMARDAELAFQLCAAPRTSGLVIV